MTYVYDIIINESNNLYDFYELNNEDNFKHIRKVPLFKVNEKTLVDFMYRKVRLSLEFLNLIKNKTEIFNSKTIENIIYAMIITSNDACLYIEFDNKGYVKNKSKFFVNEELEIIEMSKRIHEKKIIYNIINNKINRNKKTREEILELNNNLNKLNLISNDENKINYLYYEVFGTKESNNKFEELVKALKENKFKGESLETFEILTSKI